MRTDVTKTSPEPKANTKTSRGSRARSFTKLDSADLLRTKWLKAKLASVSLDVYGDPARDQREPVSLERLSDDLRRVGKLTGDQIFNEARLALSAHGLGVGKKRIAKRYSGVSFDHALRWMDRLIDEHKEVGKRLSVRSAAAMAAAKYGVGNSFNGGVKNLRTEFPRFVRAASSRPMPGRKIWVTPVEGRYTGPVKLPAGGKQVIDSPTWRLLFYTGRVSVRVLA
jgi:hypothetical protein